MKNEEYTANELELTNELNGENENTLPLSGDEGEAQNAELHTPDEAVNEADAPVLSSGGDAEVTVPDGVIEDETELRTDEVAEDDHAPLEVEIICENLLSYDGHEIPPMDEINEETPEDNGENDEADADLDAEQIETEDSEPEYDEDVDAGETTAEKCTVQTEEKPRRVDSIFDFVEICIFTLAAVFIFMSFFFRYSIVDGGSMKNTLHHQEKLILSSFLYTPECGDIVVVQDKSTALKDPIVKRIIATEGQTVKFTRTGVYVDGVLLDEPYVFTGDYEDPFGTNEGYKYNVYPSDALLAHVVDREDGEYYEVLVPDGHIFVMGDHRNNSKDSRDIGMLHEDAVIGKAVFRFFPFNKFGKIE